MKLKLPSIVAGLLLVTTAGFAAETVIVSPEQETEVRQYVKKQPLASIKLPGVELNIGSTLPDTVELHRLDVPDVKYEYVVVDGRTVLVEPQTRRIVRVLD
jgi:hypothetical protein